jgi:glycosyltransferase involved in cell wall biosynthesis
MQKAGYTSETFTNGFYSNINCREDWDINLAEEFKYIPSVAKPFFAFLESLFRYDIFFISFNGYFIGNTPLWWTQSYLFKIARKKVVVIPYGSDSYVYRRIRSTCITHALLMSYPKASRMQDIVARDVDYWCHHSDVVIQGVMGPDGFGRWDVLMPSALYIDTDLWKPSIRSCEADGRSGSVRIAHAPNHRGFKGTEFVINAVELLKKEGLLVELVLLEKMQNTEVRQCLQQEIDILVEQIIAPACGLNGFEGLASGLPTISNIEKEYDYIFQPLRRWSYFSECPLVSASPENLVDVLRKLITRPNLRKELGVAGRAYVQKYHNLNSAQYLFGNVIDYVNGRKDSLINLYHPLLGEYPKRSPKIQHPLVNNRIVD